MNVPKFKEVSGSMNDSMGVQRVVPVVEPPTADNIIADQFMQAKVEPTALSTISEQTTDEEQPPDPELKITTKPSNDPNSSDLEKVRSALKDEITRGQVEVTETEGKISVVMTSDQKDGENQGAEGLEFGQRLDEDTVALFAKVAQAQAEVVSEVEVLRSPSTEQQSFDSAQGSDAQEGEDVAQSEYEQIRSRLTTEIANGQVNVERINDEVKISLADQGAFVSGSADLRTSFYSVLASVGQALVDSPGQVTVAGHTDDVPVAFSERFQSNWDLSAARSASVADYLVGEGYINSGAVTVTGYADTVPIASMIRPPVEPKTAHRNNGKRGSRMISRCVPTLISGLVLVVASLMAGPALAETKAQKAFLERVKSVSTIDDAKLSDDALVIWPSPDVQTGLDYDAMGQQLCQEYKVYGYLVIWFMDSSKYRREKEMAMLQSYVCLEDV